MIQERIGYRFSDAELLAQALTHPSLARNDRTVITYERLEFLGDAVLDLLISEFLYDAYPDEPEGALAKRRAALVQGRTLAEIAREIELNVALQMAPGEENNGGRENDANLENALEAVLGAIYLDGGYDAVKHVALPWFEQRAAEAVEPPQDAKTALQEWAQARGLPLPEYVLEDEVGPSHAPEFRVRVSVEGQGSAEALGPSKRKAERYAAERLLKKVRDTDG